MRSPTPSAVKTAKRLFSDVADRRKILEAAKTIDLFTGLRSTVRTCAIILRDIEKSPEIQKNLDMAMAKYALQEVILVSGHKLEQVDDIINQRVG